jgi:hypothetical protein
MIGLPIPRLVREVERARVIVEEVVLALPAIVRVERGLGERADAAERDTATLLVREPAVRLVEQAGGRRHGRVRGAEAVLGIGAEVRVLRGLPRRSRGGLDVGVVAHAAELDVLGRRGRCDARAAVRARAHGGSAAAGAARLGGLLRGELGLDVAGEEDDERDAARDAAADGGDHRERVRPEEGAVDVHVRAHAVDAEDEEGHGEEEAERDADRVQLVERREADERLGVDALGLEVREEARERPQDRREPEREGQRAERAREERVRLHLERVGLGEAHDRGHVREREERARAPRLEVRGVEPVLLGVAGVDEEEPEAELLEVRDHLERPADGEDEVEREDQLLERRPPELKRLRHDCREGWSARPRRRDRKSVGLTAELGDKDPSLGVLDVHEPVRVRQYERYRDKVAVLRDVRRK